MSLTERKAGGTSPDADDYNAVVDAVVALQAGGGGGSQTLAQVLATGNDADDLGVENVRAIVFSPTGSPYPGQLSTVPGANLAILPATADVPGGGGSVSIQGGQSLGANGGGDVYLTGGNAPTGGEGGDVVLQGGYSDDGGTQPSLTLTGASTVTPGAAGKVQINAGAVEIAGDIVVSGGSDLDLSNGNSDILFDNGAITDVAAWVDPTTATAEDIVNALIACGLMAPAAP